MKKEIIEDYIDMSLLGELEYTVLKWNVADESEGPWKHLLSSLMKNLRRVAKTSLKVSLRESTRPNKTKDVNMGLGQSAWSSIGEALGLDHLYCIKGRWWAQLRSWDKEFALKSVKSWVLQSFTLQTPCASFKCNKNSDL